MTQTMTADALEFFEENQEFVASYGLSNLERSERILFNKGRRLVEQAIADAAKRSAKRVPYTDEQTQFIADAYLATEGDRDSVVSAFVREFPDSGHSADSIGQKFSRFRVLDRSFPTDTEWEIDQQVLSIAAQYPETFEV